MPTTSLAAPTPAFITVEGIDGCGKSTQAERIVSALEQAGYDVLALREPGGVVISEKIRALLLDPAHAEMSDTCELLLYAAARAQLVHERIEPALAAFLTLAVGCTLVSVMLPLIGIMGSVG